MDPDETKSLQQPPDLNGTSSKTPDTIAVPGVRPLENPVRTVDFLARRGFWGDLRKPAKRVATILVPLAVVVLIGSGLFNVAKWTIDSWTAKKPVSQQTIEQPVVKTSPRPVSVAKGCVDLPARMAQAKVTGVQVDKAFYGAHPDRVGKPLTEADADLKKEWCSIADRLITQKSAK